MKECIFCGDRVDSAEHLWPEWVLDRLPPKKISGFIGRHKNLKFDREFKVRCVCQKRCNGGWMSDLEQASQPTLGAMLEDKPTSLDVPQQLTIAAWALKTAMVLDAAVRAQDGKVLNYYSPIERHNLRRSSTIPSRTRVWLGRFAGSGLGAWTSRLMGSYPNEPSQYPLHATTILMGGVVLQTLSARVPAKYRDAPLELRCAAGPWSETVLMAWPSSSNRINWPPTVAFVESEGTLDVRRFHARWRLGLRRDFLNYGPSWL